MLYDYLVVMLYFDGNCKKAGEGGKPLQDVGSINQLSDNGWEVAKVLDWHEAGVSGSQMRQAGGCILLKRPKGYEEGIAAIAESEAADKQRGHNPSGPATVHQSW